MFNKQYMIYTIISYQNTEKNATKPTLNFAQLLVAK